MVSIASDEDLRKPYFVIEKYKRFYLNTYPGNVDYLAREKTFFIVKERTGFVGISTHIPKEKLEVKEGNIFINEGSLLVESGNVNINNGFFNVQTSSGYIKIHSANSNFAHLLTDRPKFYFNKTIQVNGALSSHTTNLDLQTQGNTRMSLKGNRQVTIGSLAINAGTHTDFKLSVDGKIVSKKVVVTLDDWADKVFEENYVLKPLSEVEEFIIEQKHLPEIPSEKEVLLNGIELGGMNKLLLLKVEELTLYLIAMQKEIDALKTIK